MQVYLPIAEISVNPFTVLGMGAAVGMLSGMFGVGGGFLVTPLLIFSGVPSLVAIATGANHVVASSVSGALAQWRRGNVDTKLGTVLLCGGITGALIGVQIVRFLRALGQIDLFIAFSYVAFLGVIGGLMLIESINAIVRTRSGKASPPRRSGQHSWLDGLPLKQRFHRSKLYISAIPPFGIGAFVGLLGAIMGVGGGFVMVPALIYLLRVPTNVVIGTSLFQTVFVAGVTTVMHASENHSVDAVLAMLLIAGGVIGAQVGVRAGQRLRGEHLRFFLASLVFAVAIRLAITLVIAPDEPFSITAVATGGS